MQKEKRFSFGKNWQNFLKTLSEDRIREAESSLQKCLSKSDLKGLTFLDIGCGSGLFSLAAHRLGATVVSFDYDQQSVECAKYLKEKFGIKKNWEIFQGSVLDTVLLKSLGTFDIVYSWGVLHHTGQMYQAFNNIIPLVKKNGMLFISIYNDQGMESRFWKEIKKTYVNSGPIVRNILIAYTFLRSWTIRIVLDLLRYGNPLKGIREYKKNRGMSVYYDLVDWAGGYPFEVAMPEEVFNVFHAKGFQLSFLKTSKGGLSCNEFVFLKD